MAAKTSRNKSSDNQRASRHPGRLSDDDAVQFYLILWSLYAFASQELKLEAPTDPEEFHDGETAVVVRDAVFADTSVIAEFVRRNPFEHSDEDLAIADGWQRAVYGTMLLERGLKTGAIFIHDDTVYRVLGLQSAFHEVEFPDEYPMLVSTALLPFKGVIVYDGILTMYDTQIGPRISSALRAMYRKAKAGGTIIDSFDEPSRSMGSVILPKDWTDELHTLAVFARQLRSSAGDPEGASEAYSLIRTAIQAAQAVTDPSLTHEKRMKVVARARRSAIKLCEAVEAITEFPPFGNRRYTKPGMRGRTPEDG